MPKCELCGHPFASKTDLERHLNRKYSCIYKRCPDCLHSFSSKEVLDKHVARGCKTKTSSLSNSIQLAESVKINQDLTLKLELTREETKKASEERMRMETEIKLLELKTKINESGNNIQVVNNVNGTLNQVIQLINFGEENLGGLTPTVMSIISQDPITEIPNLAVQKLYFNPHIRENQIIKPKLIKINNYLQAESVDLYEDGQWVNKDVNTASEVILNNTNNALKRRLRQVALQCEKKERLKRFFKECDNNYNEIKEDMICDLGCRLDELPKELDAYKSKTVILPFSRNY